MRVGVVRTDLGDGVYFADLVSNIQRPQASSAPGQARTIRRPTDTELEAILNDFALLSLRATDVAATVDTSVKDTLLIRQGATHNFITITVTAGAATPKTTIRDDLNAAFVANGMDLVASVVGTNQIQIDTVAPNSGPGAYIEIDTNVLSTLNDQIGYAAGGVIAAGLSVAALQAAVYPTPTTIDVSGATLTGLSTFANLTLAQRIALGTPLAEAIAPELVETGDALRSFAIGAIAEARAATFQPQGLPAGIGVAVVENDGVTALTYMGQ
jgi:hypothetical protein